MADIEIEADAPKPLTVNLAGESYEVRPIKASLGLALAQSFQKGKKAGENLTVEETAKRFTKILNTIFGTTVAKQVQKRLDSEDDVLDYPHIMKLLNALIEKSTGNPTT